MINSHDLQVVEPKKNDAGFNPIDEVLLTEYLVNS